VTGAAAHEFDEVPVLLGRIGISLNISYQLTVDLRRGVETKGSLDPLVFQIAVDRLWEEKGSGVVYRQREAVLLSSRGQYTSPVEVGQGKIERRPGGN